MSPDLLADVYILTGPTGSGKSRLALDLAAALGAEIVSMDSMALYRRMDVLTAKPSPADRARVPHHLIDELEPWESASVAWWLDRARACVREIRGRGRRALFVGGTPLYLKALLCGLSAAPPGDAAVRARLAAEAAAHGPQALHDRLARVDPAAAARLPANDVRRVGRALEVWELTGRPLSAWQGQWTAATPALPPGRCLWLDLPRERLYERIDARVTQMAADGLVDEVRALRALPRPPSREAAQALGYKELLPHLDGALPLEEALQRLRQRSRNFAKRQRTWMRAMPGAVAVADPWLTFHTWGLTMTGEGP
jgi:tRNA dimethylallyltransferase